MNKTKIAGVYQRVGKNDTTYYIRYRVADSVKTEKIGKKSEGCSVDKAYQVLKERKNIDNFRKIEQLQKRKNTNLSFHILAQKYFIKMRELAQEEEFLPKTEKIAKTLKNIKREESIYRNFWKDWELKIVPLNRVTKEQVTKYLFSKKNKYSDKTIYNGLTLARSIIKHTKEFYSGDNPFIFEDELNKKRFSKPKNNARKKFLSNEDSNLLLSYMKENSSHQNYTIVLTSLTTGARPDSVLNIKIEDINFQKKELKLYDFKRKIYYTTRLTLELEKALREQISKRSKREFLFYSKKSKGLKQLTEYPRSITKIFDKLFNKDLDEAEERVMPYTLRHTFANLLLQVHKVSVFDVSKLLNHASVQTTIDNYIDFSHDNVGQELEKYEKALINSNDTNHKQTKIKQLLKQLQNGVSQEEFDKIQREILSFC